MPSDPKTVLPQLTQAFTGQKEPGLSEPQPAALKAGLKETASEASPPAGKPAKEILRVAIAHSAGRVDREKQIIYGVVMAQEGPFKSEGRGEFDKDALAAIRDMVAAAPNGIKCRLAHPDESHDGVDKTLGRFRDPRLDVLTARDSEGTLKTDAVACVRGDLHLNPAADKGPFKMGDYVMTLAETDPDLFSTSLVLSTDREYRIDAKGLPMIDADGQELPPLWRPTQIMACDCVSTGDAVDGLLGRMGGSIEALGGLPNGAVFAAAAALDKHFAGKPREFVQKHCKAFLDHYLNRRYGAKLGDPGSAVGGQDEPGAPDQPESGDNNPYPGGPGNALHNGCRSTLGYHHLTACRSCGANISACGCDHVEHESRVITMAKEPCAVCKAKLEAPGVAAPPDAPGKSGDVMPEPGPDASGSDLRRRRLDLLNLEN